MTSLKYREVQIMMIQDDTKNMYTDSPSRLIIKTYNFVGARPHIYTIYNFTICFSESYLVPAATVMVISIYDDYRDPNFWPNPNEVFDSDFCLRTFKIVPCLYLPFSVGPRNCIGINNNSFVLFHKIKLRHILNFRS